jgi:hypothetical protein
MAAHNPYRSQRAIEVLEDLSMRIEFNLAVQQCFAGRDSDGLSFWGLFFAYHVCSASLSSAKLTLEPEIMKTLTDGFIKIDERWNLAGILMTYPSIHEHLLTNARCLPATPRGSHSYQQAVLNRMSNQSIRECTVGAESSKSSSTCYSSL